MKRTLLILVTMLVAAVGMAQQPERHVTPVKDPTNRTLEPDRSLSEAYVAQVLSGDTLRAQAEARKDSLRRVYKRYPLITGLSVGVNIGDLLLAAFGQDYGSVDVEGVLNMWNRLQPVVQVGVGWAKSTPDEMNYTYRGKLSPYFKLGVNYNILFKHSPDYQALVGYRFGYSTFGYDVTDVTYTGNYWRETTQWQLKGEHSHAVWGEVCAGLKVKLWGPVSMGWMLRYHWLHTYGKTTHSRPWYIPGYGTRSGRLAVSLTVYYNIK